MCRSVRDGEEAFRCKIQRAEIFSRKCVADERPDAAVRYYLDFHLVSAAAVGSDPHTEEERAGNGSFGFPLYPESGEISAGCAGLVWRN